MNVFLIIIISLLGINLLLTLLLFIFKSSKSFERKLEQYEQKNEERARLSDRLLQESLSQLQTQLLERLSEQRLQQQQDLVKFKEETTQAMNEHRQRFDKRQIESLQSLQVSLQKGLQHSSETIGLRVDKLTQETENRLKEISGQVDKRLTEGFEKTNATFNDVIKRLALIDAAQKKITELSSDVVSLQEVLNDKRSRGAFGEIQLSSLLRNMLPENNFALQHSLSNGTRVDCMLFLPQPTGNVAVDAKFPLENYRKLIDSSLGEADKLNAERAFKQDIKKHIQDIASKYIIEEETADGAMMFIPAEAVFAEIHSRHPDLIELAQKAHVWLVSPTTMMAILTTARAVIKDEATQKQVHIIREHLSYLAKDFDRFQGRMDNLARHIQQAHQDVEQVHKSAKKISTRFQKIEKVELEQVSVDELEAIPETTDLL
jgi:DNA recombination protein RmuC